MGATCRYRARPHRVEALQFDGTASGVERMAVWLAARLPGWPVRPRTEYLGWDDTTGHIEVEVRGLEEGLTGGDWLVVGGDREDAPPLRAMTDRRFKELFELEPLDRP